MTRVFCPWIACIHNDGQEKAWDSGKCQRHSLRLETVNDEDLDCVHLQLLPVTKIIDGLRSLVMDRESFFTEDMEPDHIFKEDAKVLKEAIRMIERRNK